MKKENSFCSRREFLKINSLTALGAGLSLAMVPSTSAQSPAKILNIKPRYHRWHVDPGVEWLETNTGHATLDWNLPLSHTALVLLDVWQRHYLKDTEERGEMIINNNLVPMLNKCRQSGLRIIHAPSPEVAQKHPNWTKLITPEEAKTKRDDWPPREFRTLSGPYQAYNRPHEPREEERRNLPELTFHPKVRPLANEAVVASGEELHRYCKKEGILFLLFAGFNTNACILSRDYGTIQMSNRGYQVVLIRDCTTGMESEQTQATLAQTNNAILLLEMFGQYSVASDEIIDGFSPG
ncbi:MAG: isochorismatase family protein [Cyclobacteriaceae bacterium]